MSRINSNVQSLIARRSLTLNSTALNRSLERLSTGLRINRGGDDPAGLIASETLRSDIRAISSAINNATRADTIVNIAEGGLQEVSALLLDLESLVDQTANIAGLTSGEVAANQLQIDSILQSIDRLAEATAFGDKKLLNGSLAFTSSGLNINEPTGAVQDHIDHLQVNAAKIANGSFRQVNITRDANNPSEVAKLSAVLGGTTATSTTLRNGTLGNTTTIQIRGNLGSELLSFASGATAAQIVTAVNSRTLLTGVAASSFVGATGNGPASVSFRSSDFGADEFVSVKVLTNNGTAVGNALGVQTGASENKDFGVNGIFTINGTSAIVDGLDASVRAGDLSLDLTFSTAFGGGTATATSSTFEITGGGAIFSISPTVGLSGQEALGINEVAAAALGTKSIGFLSSIKSGQTNDLASKNFTTAQRVVRKAISQIANLRGRLGSFQKDTLVTTINSLTVARENITAAESAIRDADFAVETSALTRAQILVSSATSVLQLANAAPQNVLALLG